MPTPKPLRISILCLAFTCLVLISASGYWGLRRIDENRPPTVYAPYKAHFYAWTVHWGRTEPVEDEFNWTALDRMLEFTEANHCQIVVLVNPNNPWATGGEARAPDDLDRATPLSDPAPALGYSACLYDFIYCLVEYIALYNPDLVSHLRYVNEPYFEHHWQLTASTYERDVEDYIRCLRTAYLAAHRAADDYQVSIQVSHGGLNYNRQLEREWYQQGEAVPELRPGILELFQSRNERSFSDVKNWEDFRRWVENYDVLPHCYWTDMLARESEWMDCFEVHYHFKPRFIYNELQAFEHAVLRAGGTLKPWFASEASMQLSPLGSTLFNARFHAGDMVKKWFSGMAFGLDGICTPITGYPPDRFFGLYDVDGNEYPAAQCYRFMRRLVPLPTVFQNISCEPFTAYRFRWGTSLVDIVWLDSLRDKDSSTGLYEPELPIHFRYGRVLDIFGQEIYMICPEKDNKITVSQEPVLILWNLQSAPPPDCSGRKRNNTMPDR
ncbi:MAG: hypothetical protein ABIK28_18870 [Planctomycetota bacterium]